MPEVKILALVQAVCDDCGWHTAPVEATKAGQAATREWARVHRATCPLKNALEKPPGQNFLHELDTPKFEGYGQ